MYAYSKLTENQTTMVTSSINHVILKTVLSLIFLKVNENASDYVELDYDGAVYTLNKKTKSDE